jgi:PAS domain S-box-containing protein
MKEKKTGLGDEDTLRRRAGERLQERQRNQVSKDEVPGATEGKRVLNELQVHQIELEMQNEELRRMQAELEASRARYFDLYDLAPIGYLTLSEKELILETNLTMSTLLGVARGALVKQPLSRFIFPDDQDFYYLRRKQLFETVEPQTSELRMIKKDGTALWVHMAARAVQDAKGEFVLHIVIADITERKLAEKQLQDTLENLRKAVGTTIQVLTSTVETRDPYTAGHQTRSADLARAIGTELELPQEKIDAIRIAGSIHDIGKLSIPAEILSKPTNLSDIEFSLIKEHARQGYEMLKDVESPWPLAEIVYQHHERMDGSGYPRNLKGEEICIEARILAVADVVEAMASHRPYRPGLGINKALEEIEKNRGTIYDNAVADACLRLFREKGFQLAGT